MDQSSGRSNAPQEKKKNSHAVASLALGILTVLFVGFNFTSGLLSLIGLGGIASGLLAAVLGYRGVMADRRYRRGGVSVAYTGIALGAVGAITLLLLFAFGAHPQLKPSDIGIGTPRTSYEGEGFNLSYPETWQQEDLTNQPFCDQQSVECLLGLSLPTEGSSNLTFIRYELTREVSLQEVDDFIWQMQKDNITDITLESRDEITVAGEPAVKRTYNTSNPQVIGGREYLVQVGLTHDLWYYQFTGSSLNQQAYENHRRQIMRVIRSLEFTK